MLICQLLDYKHRDSLIGGFRIKFGMTFRQLALNTTLEYFNL